MNKKEEMSQFSILIENLRKSKNMSYMETILHHCENTGLEVELAVKMINPVIKSKIKMEAEKLNFIKKTKIKRLPV